MVIIVNISPPAPRPLSPHFKHRPPARRSGKKLAESKDTLGISGQSGKGGGFYPSRDVSGSVLITFPSPPLFRFFPFCRYRLSRPRAARRANKRTGVVVCFPFFPPAKFHWILGWCEEGNRGAGGDTQRGAETSSASRNLSESLKSEPLRMVVCPAEGWNRWDL